ncbi:hypothetical protein AJ80_04909 [Polytolypa hystricis UAMH7299]|uniref:Multiple myeloma tumor-associated protein 2-like N-terminal domain-containing protein n=1 Tax=Polytolypa hystricis (strain UAMH7299) TaxID=1447883 RepID=A0A2B7Y9I5_POLH7|nr:hypothetical protein AJ80_04909 [Polytolypa hystricis UAMH7299]
MDLVAGVRKEGSRGGRDAFKWTDVKDSAHRENYLGHSVMAPVGRWQTGRDLSWYTKHDDGDDDAATEEEKANAARNARDEEIRQIKEAEQEALAKALGLPVALKSGGVGANANLIPLGGGEEVEKVVMDNAADDGDEQGARGIGFGGYGGGPTGAAGQDGGERLEGVGVYERREEKAARRGGSDRRRERSRDRGKERERDRRSRRHDDHDRDQKRDQDRERDRHDRRRHRSRSQDRERHRRKRSASRSRDVRQPDERDRDYRRRDRSRSPYERRRDHRRQGKHDDRDRKR